MCYGGDMKVRIKSMKTINLALVSSISTVKTVQVEHLLEVSSCSEQS